MEKRGDFYKASKSYPLPEKEKSGNKGFFEELLQRLGSDGVLVLIVVVILKNEGADLKLILALLYILT